MNEEVVWTDEVRVHHLLVVDRQIFQPRIGRLHDDLGFVAGGAQRAADAKHFVADGVAVAERGEDLMDARFHGYRNTGPFGAAFTASAAGGRLAARRANQPGSGSMAVFAGSFFSRSNISRYFRSMTGQA